MTPSYDGRGNMTSNGVASFGYTAENRLTSSTSSNLYYDPLDRLAHLTGSVTDLLYHGGECIQEIEANGGPTRRRYVHGPGTDEPLVWYEGAGTADRRYLHADERGSIVAVSDGSGNAIGINRYDEYGMPAATNIGSFGYTGQVWLGELGLWHYKARMYDPRLGRFLQPDPIGYGDGMNLYAYVGGDPVNFTDPTGLSVDVRLPTMYRADPFSAYTTIIIRGDLCRVRDCTAGDRLAMHTSSHALPGLNKGEFNSTGGGENRGDDACKADNRTWSGAARSVLSKVQVVADVATLGAAASGVGAPLAPIAKGVGWAAEGVIGLVNFYDGAVNGQWGHLQDQAVGLGTRLLPGGTLLQKGMRNADGRKVFRNERGQFAKNPYTANKKAFDEAAKIGQQRAGSAASEVSRCQRGR